jgi:cell shape-determining protein MreC
MKPLTRAQLEGRKEKAVRFTRDVLGDPARAAEIEAESLEDYAERRKVKLINPTNRSTVIMAKTTKTKADLAAELSDLQDENQELRDQLDVIADIVAPADEDEDDDDDDEDSDDDEEDDDPD